MSIAGDLLTSAAPVRLVCRRGTWTLEVVRLVPVDRNVFQPRVQKMVGVEAVLQHLKRTADSPNLAAAASQLMRGSRTEDDRAFDAVDGEWVPGELGARRADSARPDAPLGGASVSGEVAELRAELIVLRAVQERLRERVHRLETELDAGRRSRDVLSIPTLPSLTLPKVSDAPDLALTDVALPALSPTATRVSAGTARASSGLALPSVEAINASLIALTAEESVRVREKRPHRFDPSSLGPCWVSRLIDEDGHEVGALIADRAAVIKLGGTLISVPEPDMNAQQALATPSDDILGAMSEVANSLSETLNQEPVAARVRVKPIEPLAIGRLDWVANASAALELELCVGPGRLFLFAR